jgi:5-(carboxyamino)imidazole ribonucleotide synthase
MRAPTAVMVNLLGEGPGDGTPEGLQHALAIEGAHIHIYGKTSSGLGRKMGHVTAMGSNLKDAEAIAMEAADAIHFGRTS